MLPSAMRFSRYSAKLISLLCRLIAAFFDFFLLFSYFFNTFNATFRKSFPQSVPRFFLSSHQTAVKAFIQLSQLFFPFDIGSVELLHRTSAKTAAAAAAFTPIATNHQGTAHDLLPLLAGRILNQYRTHNHSFPFPKILAPVHFFPFCPHLKDATFFKSDFFSRTHS